MNDLFILKLQQLSESRQVNLAICDFTCVQATYKEQNNNNTTGITILRY